MIDYIESPFDPLVAVNWPGGGNAAVAKLTGGGVNPTSQGKGWGYAAPFVCAEVLMGGGAFPTNTWTQLTFTISSLIEGDAWDPTKTVEDLLGATFTQPATGQSITPGDFAGTLFCTVSVDSKKYAGGGTHDNTVNAIAYANMASSGKLVSSMTLAYISNSALTGANDAGYSLWIAGETVKVAWP